MQFLKTFIYFRKLAKVCLAKQDKSTKETEAQNGAFQLRYISSELKGF
jgi:hypothetical protein